VARPKSIKQHSSGAELQKRMLSGLMSRWIIFFSFRLWRASKSCFM